MSIPSVERPPLDMFAPATLGRLRLNNRFVRSATWEGLAGEDGSVTPGLTELLVRLARGQVGLVIAGHAYVDRQGQAGPWKLGVDGPHRLSGLSALTRSVRQAGGRIAAQLAHGGQASLGALTGLDVVGPSDGEGFRAMTGAEIAQTAQAFGRAAALCREAGFDAVQIHAAHGYLLSQFLSPHYNRRTDDYGGSLENRSRLLLDVVAAVRRAVGEDYPVLCKMNAEDFLPDGFTADEAVTVAGALRPAGLDVLELSGGTGDSGRLGPVRPGRIKTPEQQAWYRQTAARIKAYYDLPLILVGGIRTVEVARDLVADGVCDAVALCRPLIREPELVARWKAGDLRQAACVSDNLCFRPASQGQGIFCLTEKRQNEKAARA